MQEQKMAVESNAKRLESGVEQPAVYTGRALLKRAKYSHSDTVEAEACFEAFKLRITHAAELPTMNRNWLMGNAFRLCCPIHPNAWLYSVMVVKHLTKLEYDPAPVLRKTLIFGTPPTYTTESREFLECLEQLYWLFPKSQRHFHQLHVKLAEAASLADLSTGAMHDRELLLLIRQLWQSAYLHNVEREDSIIHLLRTLVSKLKHEEEARSLRSILADTAKTDVRIMKLNASACEMEAWLPFAEHVLSCIPQEHLKVFATSITSRLMDAIERKVRHPKSTYKYRLRTWLELLHRLDTMSKFILPSPTLLDLAIAQITKRVFATQPPIHVGPDLLVNALHIKLSHKGAYLSTLTDEWFAYFESSPAFTREHVSFVSAEHSLVALFSQMRNDSLPYQHFVEPLMKIMVQHAGLRRLLKLLIALEQHKLTIRDVSFIDRLIVDKAAMIQQRISAPTEEQHQRTAFVLWTCQRIYDVVRRMTSTFDVCSLVAKEDMLDALQARRRFRHILDRAQANHALPLAYRNLSANLPSQQGVNLIHQLAHYYSFDLKRSRLENWRAIYYLYRYLMIHNLPVGPLFTKAVVRASLIRPLIENRFVSARRLIWVCQLVARVEGEEVAKRIESDFWHWRGDLFRYAKGAFVQAGGSRYEKAHVGRMKRLGLI